MIFVVLGTQKFQLNRLLLQMDQYIEEGIVKEEVFAQIGHSDYEPKHYGYKRFLDKEEFDTVVAQSHILITHSGVGSIISGLQSSRPVIVYPRLAKFKEHVDDHQLDIARAFEQKKYVLCCKEEDQLYKLIHQCDEFSFQQYHSQRERIIKLVSDYIATKENAIV